MEKTRLEAANGDFESAITAWMDEQIRKREIKSIDIGVPGAVEGKGYWRTNEADGKLYKIDIGDSLEKRYKIPVVLENDLNATAIGFGRCYAKEFPCENPENTNMAFLYFEKGCIGPIGDGLSAFLPKHLLAEILYSPDVWHDYFDGMAPNVRFYWDFFVKGKPAYVEISYLSLPDAAALIHSAGGAAVLAHPGQNLDGDDELLDKITKEKIDGIEAFSSYYSREQALHYLEASEQKGLFVTCGSDFHGKNKPNIVLGGHNALWSDERLPSELKKCSLWKMPVL